MTLAEAVGEADGRSDGGGQFLQRVKMKVRDERPLDRVMQRWTEKKRALPLGQFRNLKRMFTAAALSFAGGDVETTLLKLHPSLQHHCEEELLHTNLPLPVNQQQ